MISLKQYIDPQVLLPGRRASIRSSFQNAEPFSYVTVDNFLDADFIARLEADFPSKGPEYDRFCMEDGGQIGSNYANNDAASFPPAFRELDELMSSDAFRELISDLTGIPDLLYDADYFGGGIRESQSKTFLPAHIDFNHHPRTASHRRLNLLLYLNRDWEPEWGGAIQVHKDPRVHADNLVEGFDPVFNRIFLFETSEISWHSFSRIAAPPGRARRAFTIYYYTTDRPDASFVKLHNTEYVEPPLPEEIVAGRTLTPEDMDKLREALQRRDDRIQMLYRIRAEADHKYAHVWKEYEYYLEKSRRLEAELNGDRG